MAIPQSTQSQMTLPHNNDLAEFDIKKRWEFRPPVDFPHARARGWGFDKYGLWQEFRVEGVRFQMRYIPPGRFLMGSPVDEPNRFKESEQQHQVSITRGFWLGEAAVTQALWLELMGSNPSNFNSEKNTSYTLDHPVEQVSWDDCQIFLEKLNEKLSGGRFALPTEAQWEYACRAGTVTPFYTGRQMTTDQANYDGNYPYEGGEQGVYREHTVPVKSFSPNAWGLYQMSGNVYEWCADGMREYDSEAVEDPLGPLDDGAESSRVLRGGSWSYDAGACRSASRDAG
ncbi:MAG: formylglycine-generating enzyme family protein, partial [Gammaproteobacteria bacterium]